MTARAAVLLAVLCVVPACATGRARLPPAPGIWPLTDVPHALTARGADDLLSSLRRITGLTGLGFDAAGRLALTSVGTRAGSPLAASLLLEALESGDTIVLEEHSGSSAVTFGQIEPEDYAGSGGESQGRDATRVWRLRLDFDDFRGVSGPARVRQAFDPGFVFLHELLHTRGCDDARDPQAEGLGACEAMLNRVRAELGLPRRVTYAAQWLSSPAHGLRQAQMVFVDGGPSRGRPRARHLIFAPGLRGAWPSPPPSSARSAGLPSTAGRPPGSGLR